jgi:cell division protein FtsZ
VKFTVLATGFGIENVPGMEKVIDKLNLEEQRRLEELEEKAIQQEDRRIKYYGKEKNSRSVYKKRPNIYLFNLEDLDNDDVISVIDTTPTFSRAKTVVESLQNSSEANEEAAQVSESNAPAGDNGNAIMF